MRRFEGKAINSKEEKATVSNLHIGEEHDSHHD